MKNIFILKTDKSSRLYEISSELTFSVVNTMHQYGVGRNIYITSQEDLILGGYHFNSKYGDEPQKTNQRDIDSRKYWEEEDYYISKIILTNDSELIKNGVQEIDNEFLQWFVNNSDCEFVEVILNPVYKSTTYDQPDRFNGFNYRLKIPQEKVEHKGNVLTTEEVMKERSSAYKFINFEEAAEIAALDWFVKANKKEIIFDLGWIKIFEAGAKWAQEGLKTDLDYNTGYYDGMKVGVQWQQEQTEKLYTKEDMQEAFNAGNKRGHSGYPDTDNWTQPTFEDFLRKKEAKTEEK